MASSRLRAPPAAGSVPHWRVPKVLLLAAVRSSSLLGHDLITASGRNAFSCSSLVIWPCVPALASCCRYWSTRLGAAIALVCWPSSRSAPRSVSCWRSRCAWRGAVDISNRSRWFASATGSALLLVTFIVPTLLPVMVLVALVPVVFAEPYIRWQRGLAFTVITAGCVLAMAALARFLQIPDVVATRRLAGSRLRSSSWQCRSTPFTSW